MGQHVILADLINMNRMDYQAGQPTSTNEGLCISRSTNPHPSFLREKAPAFLAHATADARGTYHNPPNTQAPTPV